MTNLRNKIIYSILTTISFILLVFYSIRDLLETNLSRIANYSMKDYFLLMTILLFIGISTYIILKKLNYRKYSLIGLFIIIIGAIIPYNYLDEASFSCTLHTILAYVSFVAIMLVIIMIGIRLRIYNKRKYYFMCIIFMIVCAINLYEFGKYGFVNTLMELTYIGYLLLMQIVTYIEV